MPSQSSSPAPSPDPQAGLGIYVHWPFCQAKCPYCDFNSHVAARVEHDQWRDAFEAEIARYGAELPDRIVGSIFFGGGTPSLMEPETVACVVDAVRTRWRTTNDIEVTLEANPSSVEAGRFRAYREAGVNRVSLGIQALNDADLRRLGRLHDAAAARAAFEIARRTFDRVSFDLIYARQDQTLSQWRSELGTALALAADHLSLYQLTIEDETAFGARHRNGTLRGLPSDDLSADLYDLTTDMCDSAGLPAYEVSNHARPGAESRHNMIYWTGGDYVGIGPGSHGRLTHGASRYATQAERDPRSWLRAVRENGVEQRTRLTDRDRDEEYLLMGLRVTGGVQLDRLTRINGIEEKILYLEDLGMVVRHHDRLAATRSGITVLNAVLRHLLA